ncbi:MAG: CAP domain-containing protein [Symploca sp. SIO2B6]|nr:CAP domain-containing protein [Symploca sp. SIO2B6]
MLYQSQPNSYDSQYWFPCGAEGGFTIAWQQGNQRHLCDHGVEVNPKKQNKSLSLVPGTKQGVKVNQEGPNKSLSLVPGTKQVIIKGHKESRRRRSLDCSIFPIRFFVKCRREYTVIDVLLGDIDVKTEENPEGVRVKEGERFSYPGGDIDSIDAVGSANSCETQKFFNLTYWPRGNKPPAVVNAVHEQLRKHRAALGIFGSEVSLSALEQEVVDETNFARTNPKAYAELLKKKRQSYRGQEGLIALDEAIDFLDKLDEKYPLSPLEVSRGMSQASRDHVNDQGPIGGFGHTGSDDSEFYERLNLYGDVGCQNRQYESLSYGSTTGRDLVMQLIIDDGTRDRGHRKAIFNRDFQVTGVACGSHASDYRSMCTITYAGGYREREDN